MDATPAGIELPGIEQVAFVVEDLDAALRRYVDLLSIEPWTVYEATATDIKDGTYRGEAADFGMRYAISSVDETMLELIEPTEGPTIYRDHLDEHGESVHHVAYFSWSELECYEVVERFERAGIEVIQSGALFGTEFWYFDTTEQLGTVFETAIRRNIEERPYETYPPDADGSQLTR